LLSVHHTCAQDAGKLASFREKVLPEYKSYFNSAELSENGQLRLSAIDQYVSLPTDKKRAVMANLITAWRESLVFVQYGSKTEMWSWDAESGNAQILDQWDLNQAPEVKIPKTKLNAHPWFIYLGYEMGGVSTSQDINITFNIRVGCYLLANKWDVAALFGFTTDIDSTYSVSYGIISRVHFPIPRSKISPSVGLQVMGSSLTTGTETTYTTTSISTSAVVGVSWFIGIGSVDFDLNIGTRVSGMGGYTVMPGMLKR